jgi:hypothetical protein
MRRSILRAQQTFAEIDPRGAEAQNGAASIARRRRRLLSMSEIDIAATPNARRGRQWRKAPSCAGQWPRPQVRGNGTVA